MSQIRFLRETEEQCGRNQSALVAAAITRETLFRKRADLERVLATLVQFAAYSAFEAERGVMSEAYRIEARRVRGML